MSQERIEAAAKAYMDNAGDCTYRDAFRLSLEAADAVMFSDEAIKGVAELLAAIKFPEKEWGELKTSTTEYLVECAWTIVAALKGDA